jgi:hypothetical protein
LTSNAKITLTRQDDHSGKSCALQLEILPAEIFQNAWIQKSPSLKQSDLKKPLHHVRFLAQQDIRYYQPVVIMIESKDFIVPVRRTPACLYRN